MYAATVGFPAMDFGEKPASARAVQSLGDVVSRLRSLFWGCQAHPSWGSTTTQRVLASSHEAMTRDVHGSSCDFRSAAGYRWHSVPVAQSRPDVDRSRCHAHGALGMLCGEHRSGLLVLDLDSHGTRPLRNTALLRDVAEHPNIPLVVNLVKGMRPVDRPGSGSRRCRVSAQESQ
jgi:hypothetical protein